MHEWRQVDHDPRTRHVGEDDDEGGRREDRADRKGPAKRHTRGVRRPRAFLKRDLTRAYVRDGVVTGSVSRSKRSLRTASASVVPPNSIPRSSLPSSVSTITATSTGTITANSAKRPLWLSAKEVWIGRLSAASRLPSW